ncbi:MAG: HYR domain-containing protein [Planctomycetes bacterium]|nr:HYR domain-containing protein [Planctomycetota bacterium]
MNPFRRSLAFVCAISLSASGATVTIEPVVRSLASGRDPVPGRAAPVVFREGASTVVPPVINDSGVIAFRARSASSIDNNQLTAIGIYLKRPSVALSRLVDTTTDSGGNPTFPVPSRAAGTRFTNFSSPTLTNTGYVIFVGTFTPGPPSNTGRGIYAASISGGPIVPIVDNFTTVPGNPTGTFNDFTSPTTGLVPVVVNDSGQIAYWGTFLLTGNPNAFNGLFGSTVAGGAGTRLADSTQIVSPAGLPAGAPAGTFLEIRSGVAINSGGIVAFRGKITPSSASRGGVFTIPVIGGTVATAAFRGQTAPNRSVTFSDTFGFDDNAIDITNSGVVIFSNNLPSNEFGHYAATPSGASYSLSRIIDTLGNIPIPGDVVPPAEFSGGAFPSANNSGHVGVYSFVINTTPPPPSGISPQGFYSTDVDGTPISLVANMSTAPPGLSPPSGGFPRFSNFQQESCAINDSGNMSFAANGSLTSTTGFLGAYFFDACAPELVRISDSTISLSQLGSLFDPSTNRYDLWQLQGRHGHLRSLNASNDVAFLAVFNNFDFGMYIAHVTVSGGGQVTMTCPNNASVACGHDTSPASTGSPTTSGCGTITVSSSDATTPGCGGTSTITRTWSASNGNGGSASCMQTITVTDTTGPALSGVPTDVSVECDAVPNTGAPTAMDACSGSVTSVALSETRTGGACPNAYILTRTWTSTDACGNTSTAKQIVTVGDSSPPSLVGVPADVTVECDAVPEPANVSALDTCGGTTTLSFSETRIDGPCAATYQLVRTWTATDACGNSASASQLVNVQDTTEPVLGGVPSDVAVECDSVPSAANVTATDNCDTSVAVNMTENHLDGACDEEYTLTRQWLAVDNCGNTTMAFQVINVVDTTGPMLTGIPANMTIECDAVPAPASPSATDNCDGSVAVAFTESTAAGSCPDYYALTRTWTASDNCGHTDVDTQTITVVDTTNPTIACPVNTTLQCHADTSVAANGSATGSDNCGGVSIVNSDAAIAGCGDTQSITRTWTATDDCGNSASCNQMIATVDTTPPTITCPPNKTLQCPANTGVVANGSASGSDDCGGVTVVNGDVSTPGCGATQTITRTWMATDDCGNHAACNQTVATIDTVPPVLTVNTTPIVKTDTNCNGSEPLTLPTGTATDACNGSVMVTKNAPLNFPAGQTTTVTYTATDTCGNTSTADLSVTVHYGATVEIRAERHYVQTGSHPVATKVPLVGILACIYDKSNGSCVASTCGINPASYQCILDHCTPTNCGTTDASGIVDIDVSPGNYLAVSGDATKTVLPDPLGVSVGDVHCGETHQKYLMQIITATGDARPGKVTRLTGSELLIIEPEFIVWNDTVQLYPFVFESIGDWGVTAAVTPPEGFVADYDALSTLVNDDLKAVQFTITEVGSELVPTQTEFTVQHKGKLTQVRSEINLKLTPDYARSRGFKVEELRARGLIEDRDVQAAPVGPLKIGKAPTRASGR